MFSYYDGHIPDILGRELSLIISIAVDKCRYNWIGDTDSRVTDVQSSSERFIVTTFIYVHASTNNSRQGLKQTHCWTHSTSCTDLPDWIYHPRAKFTEQLDTIVTTNAACFDNAFSWDDRLQMAADRVQFGYWYTILSEYYFLDSLNKYAIITLGFIILLLHDLSLSRISEFESIYIHWNKLFHRTAKTNY